MLRCLTTAPNIDNVRLIQVNEKRKKKMKEKEQEIRQKKKKKQNSNMAYWFGANIKILRMERKHFLIFP
jgi:CRISPR/Cas system-associated protein endoribonuclease Cas2